MALSFLIAITHNNQRDNSNILGRYFNNDKKLWNDAYVFYLKFAHSYPYEYTIITKA